jgi:hypothetical protein
VCYICEVKRSIFVALFVFCWALAVLGQEGVRYCAKCGKQAYSKLAMSCAECNGNLFDPGAADKASDYASLEIELLYLGEKTSDLYPYVKLYVNGNYIDKIELSDDYADSRQLAAHNKGLERRPTAIYKKVFEKIAPGVKALTLELRFKRMGGLLKSNKKITFDYVSFKGGEKTHIKHYFNSAVSFTTPNKPEDLPSRNPYLKEVPEVKMFTATGTAELGVGL